MLIHKVLDQWNCKLELFRLGWVGLGWVWVGGKHWVIMLSQFNWDLNCLLELSLAKFQFKKNVWSEKNVRSENQKIVETKILWAQRHFASKKILCPKGYCVQINFRSKRFWAQKYFGHKKFLDTKKILGPKI